MDFVPSCLFRRSLFFKSFPRRRALIDFRKKLVIYFLQFQELLKKHLTTEFEVNLQNGSITDSGREMLLKLQKENEFLQFETRIDEMCDKIFEHDASSSMQELLYSVKDDICAAFPKIISKVQQNVQLERRKKDNVLD